MDWIVSPSPKFICLNPNPQCPTRNVIVFEDRAIGEETWLFLSPSKVFAETPAIKD